MGYNIGMVSLGCAKNQLDAEIMLGLLDGDGHKIVASPEDADIIIVNTCGFIESAKQESIDTILEMAEYKKQGCKALIVTGCLAERYNKEVLEQLPEVDGLLGVGDYDKIAEIINSTLQGEKPMIYGHKDIDPADGLPRILTTPSYTAYIKIAEGCDNHCTYCAIPKIRGKYRSRKPEDIIDEAKRLAKSGVKELIIIAQDTTRYGKDLNSDITLAKLLEELCKIPGIEWIRTHYYYTEAVTDELIEIMAREEKICNYIDMPIQHINNNVLRKMARRTNRQEIEKTLKKIRQAMPDCIIRTSLIVGFPGETEEEFSELFEFVKTGAFDRMGVFSYSQEEGTPAAEYDNQTDEDVKEDRLSRLMQLQQRISLEKNKEKLSKTIKVLAEGYDEECYLYYGRSYGDSIGVDGKVYFAAEDEVLPGDFVNVEILDCDEYDLTGKVVEVE